jgi:hypothetical protein
MAAAPQRHRLRLSMRARLKLSRADKQCSLSGRDIRGRTKRQPWSYFVYPYEEANGQPVKDLKKTLSFREISGVNRKGLQIGRVQKLYHSRDPSSDEPRPAAGFPCLSRRLIDAKKEGAGKPAPSANTYLV